MRRNDTGFVGTLTDDVSEDVSFRRDIQCRCGFIEKQHRSIAEDGTGDGKPLGLAFGETAATFPDAAVDGIRQMLNKIPGVTVDLTSGVNATVTKLQRDRKYEKWASGYTEVVKPWENIDLGKAYKAGRDWGANLGKSGLMGTSTGELEIPQAADVKDLLTNIDKNTGKIAKTVDLSDEQIKMLVDVAERKYVNNVNLTSQTPVITVQGQNTGSTERMPGIWQTPCGTFWWI